MSSGTPSVPALPGDGTASRLAEALQTVGVHGTIELAGRWATIEGARCLVYVVEAAHGAGFFTWCDAPHARTLELYRDPVEAIRAGLRRAAHDDVEGNKTLC